MKRHFILAGQFLLLVFLCGSVSATIAEEVFSVGGFPPEEALRLGERMFREGILPGGGSLTAIAMGDTEVDGRMFSCDNCHQRSGLGSKEGTVVTWAISGKELYQPRRRTGAWRPPENEKARHHGPRSLPPAYRAPDARPAYTDETLAKALREGIDPTGRKLNAMMPRYMLNDRDMAILIYYLKHLSNGHDLGVDDTTLRLATVVTEGVPPADREAMLSMLQTQIEAHNAQSRNEERRAIGGPFYRSEMNLTYRRLELDVWRLNGPREGWRIQLETYYRQKPVFALLGGIANGSWSPIHQFSEEHGIPCLFPLTDLPVISETDWYTLYFSKGIYQEGERAATYLSIEQGISSRNATVVQLFHPGEWTTATARGFQETWERLGNSNLESRELGEEETVTDQLWRELAASSMPTVVLLWLEKRGNIEALQSLSLAPAKPTMVFVSSSLLEEPESFVPNGVRDIVYLTFPHSLPDENQTRLFAVKRYLQTRNLPLINMNIQAKMYFMGVMVPMTLKRMRSEFYRDYLLEKIDMMDDRNSTIASYPRLSFGPGQRYASKGCYIVQLTKGPIPEFVKMSEWVPH